MIGVALDCEEALHLCKSLRPMILAIDMQPMPSHLWAALQKLQGRPSPIAVVAFNADVNAAAIQAALSSGVVGYLGPDAATVELVRTFEAVLAGRLCVGCSTLKGNR